MRVWLTGCARGGVEPLSGAELEGPKSGPWIMGPVVVVIKQARQIVIIVREIQVKPHPVLDELGVVVGCVVGVVDGLLVEVVGWVEQFGCTVTGLDVRGALWPTELMAATWSVHAPPPHPTPVA